MNSRRMMLFTDMKKLTMVGMAVAMMSACTSVQNRADREKFHSADVNGDGKLSLEEANKAELARVFKSIDFDENQSVNLQEAQDVEPDFDSKKFKQYDRNGDGKVTYAEFYQVQVAKGGVKRRFDAADSDRDGFVTLKEADARVQFLQAQAGGQL